MMLTSGRHAVGHVALAGTVVAYTDTAYGIDAATTDIVVVDVGGGRRLNTLSNVGGYTDACVLYFQDVVDLVVTRRGSVAWTDRQGRKCKATKFAVYRAETSRPYNVLDAGPDIDPTSLRLAEHRVSWEDGGQNKSAPIS